MTSQASCMPQNSEYLENEASYSETKNTLTVYFDMMFD